MCNIDINILIVPQHNRVFCYYRILVQVFRRRHRRDSSTVVYTLFVLVTIAYNFFSHHYRCFYRRRCLLKNRRFSETKNTAL